MDFNLFRYPQLPEICRALARVHPRTKYSLKPILDLPADFVCAQGYSSDAARSAVSVDTDESDHEPLGALTSK